MGLGCMELGGVGHWERILLVQMMESLLDQAVNECVESEWE